MGLIEAIRGSKEKQVARALERARRKAWIFHDRQMRDGGCSWMGFFAPTNGMTLYTFYTVNQGFSRAIEAVENVAGDLDVDASISVAGIEIVCVERRDGEKGYQLLEAGGSDGPRARIRISAPAEDWKTGKREARHEVSVPGRFNLTIYERYDEGCRSRSGSTSPQSYSDYVAFFDIFRRLVAETDPVGNQHESEFQEACTHLVDADGGLPGRICLRDYGLMAEGVTSAYLHDAVRVFENIHAVMTEEGFIYGQRKLEHGSLEMFALPATFDGRSSFVLGNRNMSRVPYVFSFDKAGRKVSRIEIREGLDEVAPCVSYDVRSGECHLADPDVADRELKNGLRLLRATEEVLCGRRIDYSAYEAFEISDDFRTYAILGGEMAGHDPIDGSPSLMIADAATRIY